MEADSKWTENIRFISKYLGVNSCEKERQETEELGREESLCPYQAQEALSLRKFWSFVFGWAKMA